MLFNPPALEQRRVQRRVIIFAVVFLIDSESVVIHDKFTHKFK